MKPARLAGMLIALSAGLLFYWAHRSEHTVSNQVLRWLGGPAWWAEVRVILRGVSPVPRAFHGCLPSALWCFVVASGCGGWVVRLGASGRVSLTWIAAGLNAVWELVQAADWTNGRADGLDVVAGVAGCALARIVFGPEERRVEFLPGWNWRTGLTVACVSCMALAQVQR